MLFVTAITLEACRHCSMDAARVLYDVDGSGAPKLLQGMEMLSMHEGEAPGVAEQAGRSPNR